MILREYTATLKLDSHEAVRSLFYRSLLSTNRTHSFFVDWAKVKAHVDAMRDELNLLNSLIRHDEFDRELRRLLSAYPNVLKAIPILLALRDLRFNVIESLTDPKSDTVNYDFTPRTLSAAELDATVEFVQKTGLRGFFETMCARSIQDYAAGVEVGMDTNARKNRSGTAMEDVLKPLMDALRPHKLQPLYQKQFRVLQDDYGIPVPRLMRDRKADILVIGPDRRVANVETNFFAGTGSKPQEIVDSYIQRQSELRGSGIRFIWVTDGAGWNDQKSQMDKALEVIDYPMNLHFVRRGVLKAALLA